MFTFVSRSSFALAALALAAVNAPALAAKTDGSNEIATSPGASEPTSVKPRDKRYCFLAETTGSRLPVKVCKTRKQWEAEGVPIPTDR